MQKVGKQVLMMVVVAVVSAALTVSIAADKTVGQFVQDLARVKNLTATDPQIAADSLAAAGVRLPSGLDFSAPLTEGLVTDISGAAGLKLTASDPEAVFTAEQVDQFFSAFSTDLNSGSGITVRGPGTCALTGLGECAVPGADCEKNGNPGFCQPANGNCNCNTGKAKGKRKQVVTPGEPE